MPPCNRHCLLSTCRPPVGFRAHSTTAANLRFHGVVSTASSCRRWRIGLHWSNLHFYRPCTFVILPSHFFIPLSLSCSATMPPPVERLARKYLRRPVVINIGSAGKAVDLITQRVLVVKDNEKPSLLERELSCVSFLQFQITLTHFQI